MAFMAGKKRDVVALGPITPAALVIALFGGTYPLARDLNIVSHSTVARWQKNKGGLIPAHQMPAILTLARKKGIKLTERDVIYGRPN
jgi:hypothetical protein